MHTSAQGYVALIAQERFADAYRVASEPNPFPAVCGRVCTHKCETDCTRGEIEQPIAIAGLKRFVADFAFDNVPLPEPVEATFTEKVAIVGAGPSGLSCARDLALLGYQTTVFEAKPEPGGMLRFGIPEYRLPKAALQQDIDRILALGVELQCNKAAGADFTIDSLLADGYQAVFMGVGLQGGRPLPIPGNDLEGVFTAVDLLRDATLEQPVAMGKNVVVIGGGDVAFDAGRTAVRLGAEHVQLVCIEDDATMPASADEIEEGLDESISFICSCMPTAVVAGPDGRAAKVEFTACTLGEADARGWRPPGAPRQHLQRDRLRHGDLRHRPGHGRRLRLRRHRPRGRAQPDRHRQADPATGREGVFAGGDAAARGPWTAIEAVAAGRRGARAIHNFLRGEELLPLDDESMDEAKPDDDVLAQTAVMARLAMPHLAGAARKLTWDEVNTGFSAEQAVTEAKRCLNCAVCSECMECVRACGPAPCCTASTTASSTSRSAPSCWPPASTSTTPATRASTATAATPTSSRPSSTSACSPPRAPRSARSSARRTASTPARSPSSSAWARATRTTSTAQASAACSPTSRPCSPSTTCPACKPDVFLMDMRAQGKGFDAFYQRAQDMGVNFIRSRPSYIKEDPLTHDLLITWEDEAGQLSHRPLRHGRAVPASSRRARRRRRPATLRRRPQPSRLLRAARVRAARLEPRGRLRGGPVRRAQGHPRLGRPGLGRGGQGDDRPGRLARHAHRRQGVPGRAATSSAWSRAWASSSATAARTSPA